MAEKEAKSAQVASSKKASAPSQSSSSKSSLTTGQSKTQPQTEISSSSNTPDIVENYVILWLDPNVDSSKEETKQSIRRLKSIVNAVVTFDSIDHCRKYLERIKKETVFLIISDRFIEEIASLECTFTQLHSIYVLCDEKSKMPDAPKAFIKGKGVFTQVNPICKELEEEIRQLNNDLTAGSVISASPSKKLNELEPSFMYYTLLKEICLTEPYDERSPSELANFCRSYYQGEGSDESNNINEFAQQYRYEKSIWWYTKECFLYKMLNKALRMLDTNIIVRMSFVIRDIHKQIESNHKKLEAHQRRLKLFRGQKLLKNDLEKQKKSKGHFLAFNNFLSTTSDCLVARGFTVVDPDCNDLIGVLYEIDVSESDSSVPFCPVAEMSAVLGESEYLFSVCTVFRIGDAEMINEQLWKIHLTLTNSRDPSLKRLTDHIRISLGHESGFRRLAKLMLLMEQFDKALEVYQNLLNQVDTSQKSEVAFLHHQLGYVFKQKGDLKQAFSHYQESLKICLTYMQETDPRLSSTYSNIGGILKQLGDYDGAMKFYQLVLKIDLAAPKPNQLEIAIDHNNIGSVLDDQKKYSEALKSYEESLDIKLAHLPPNHPSLANTYSNIGLIHRKMGDYSSALLFYQKMFDIQRKSLPENHSSLIVARGKLASVLEELQRYDEAIDHVKAALKIAEERYDEAIKHATAAHGTSEEQYGALQTEVTKWQQYLQQLQLKRSHQK